MSVRWDLTIALKMQTVQMSRDRMLAGAGKATQKMGKPAWTLMSVK